MNNINDIELFDRYLKGNLNDLELAGLSERLSKDPDFKKLFDQHITVISTLKIQDQRSRIALQLENIHSDLMKEKSLHRERKLTRTLKIHSSTMAVAASVTIIVLIGSIFVINYINSLRSREDDFIRLRREVAQIKLSQREVVATLKDVNKEKSTGSFTGTGFLINKEGYVLTCYHLVKDEDSLVLRNNKYGSIKAYLIKYDLSSDLALLKIRDSSFKVSRPLPVVINDKESMLGEKVFTLGYPKYDVVYSEGVVSSVTGYQGDTSSYQISLPLNPGNSGGPLVNEAGYVIGIVNGKNITQEGSAFALKSYYLKKFLVDPIDSLTKINISWNRKLTNADISKPIMVRNLSDYIFEVKVFE
jgi:S1-C subfamily serine protease